MRLLGDIPIGRETIQFLKNLGHDVIGVADTLGPKAPDQDIVSFAARENRTIICFDLDFPAILSERGSASPSLIVFRTRKHAAAEVNRRLAGILSELGDELEDGIIVIVEDGRYRVRRLPIPPKP